MSEYDLQRAGGSGDGPRADRPKRRHFSAEFKSRIVDEYDAAPKGEKGEVLRREGLYDSHIKNWRRQRDEGALKALSGERSVPSSEVSKERAKEKAELAKLRRENARLAKKVKQTEAALQIVGKWHELLEMMSESSDSENS
jgi:transposase-like protein